MSLTVTMCALVPRLSWSCLWNQIVAFSFIVFPHCRQHPYPMETGLTDTTWAILVACILTQKFQGGLNGDRVSCNNIDLSFHADNSAESPKRWMMTGPALQWGKTSFRQKCHMRDPFVENDGNVGEELKKFWWAERWIALETSYLPSFRFLSDSWDSNCFPRQFQLWIKNNNSLTEGFESAWMLQACHLPRKQARWAHGWGVGAETGRPSWGWVQMGFFLFSFSFFFLFLPSFFCSNWQANWSPFLPLLLTDPVSQ